MLVKSNQKSHRRGKMSKSSKSERRLYPRLQQELPLKVIANGYDFATQTQNISCVGAYCHINKYVPPFTKVMITVSLPASKNNKNKTNTVECKGVIVRTEDEAKGGYNIAIFFNGIQETPRKKITEYINQILPESTLA